MARRKIALIFLFLFLLLMVLSPWATAPSPSSRPDPKEPEAVQAEASVNVPEATEPVRIQVSAALDEDDFRELLEQNERQAYRFPDVTVEMKRVAPEEAYDAFRRQSRVGDPADVLLMDSDWVQDFAVSGFLMPADNAFIGDALSEQFDALLTPLRWNEYTWGVPRDFNPYAIVWNLEALRAMTGDNAAPPADLDGWRLLAAASSEAAANGETAVSGEAAAANTAWLALDGQDPLAMLAWVQAASGQRTDTLWDEADGADPWAAETPRGQALALLDQERSGTIFASNGPELAALVSAGKAAAAVLPYAEARRLTEGTAAGSRLRLDTASWKLQHVWPRSRSYVVTSRTDAEEAAKRWIAVMTEAEVQRNAYLRTGFLPVYRSLYQEETALKGLFPVASAANFPYQAPAEQGPGLPQRLTAVRELWREWTAGRLGLDGWLARWGETSADFELND